MKKILIITLLIIFLPVITLAINSSSKNVLIVRVDGIINIATEELISEAVNFAATSNIEAIVILIDTPGGMMDSTFKIVSIIENSKIPIIGYVYPVGGKAWSAGTVILMSCHIAAMSPSSVIGSCQPVSFNPLGGSIPVNDTKTINALTTYLIERAKMHNRNETAARLFVERNLNLGAEDALKNGVIEFLALSIDELLKMINGVQVRTISGNVKLNTENAQIINFTPGLRVNILKIICEPTIAYLFLLLGLYALIFGFATPGYGGEAIGAILIILGLIGLGLLSVNILSLILIGLGAILLIAELVTPGFGIIGSGGIFCIIIGTLLLMSEPMLITGEWLTTFYTIGVSIAAVLGGFILFAAYKVLKAKRAKPVIGIMIGDTAIAIDDIDSGGYGFVRYHGEYWKAKANQNIKKGQKVLIKGKDGPILIIEPLKE
ncbi:MAG: nodulation protein NfeD [Candidatus Methanomethylicia archaeon]